MLTIKNNYWKLDKDDFREVKKKENNVEHKPGEALKAFVNISERY